MVERKRMEGTMSLMQSRIFRRVGFAAVAALMLGAGAMAATPAQAHDYAYRAPVAHAAVFHHSPFGFWGHPWHHIVRWGHRW